MLNHSRVLDYIKTNLGFPYVKVELDDDKIIEYLTNHTLREFSKYVPYRRILVFDATLAVNKVRGKQNEFLINLIQ